MLNQERGQSRPGGIRKIMTTRLLDPLTIVTAASSNHYRCLQSLLWTIAKFESDARVIVWDLGLSEDESTQLTTVPPFYLKTWDLRKFDFTKYPAYFALDSQPSTPGSQLNGRMGFRPITLQLAANEFGGTVLWMDAGCQLGDRLTAIRWTIEQRGVYCACTAGTIGEKLDQTARTPLGVTDDLLQKPLRDAGICGFDTTNPAAKALIDRWAAVALQPACTAPPGTTKSTHRQDAVFAVLLLQAAKANNWQLYDQRLPGAVMRRDWMTLAETQYLLGTR
jgi:hypothetical protein